MIPNPIDLDLFRPIPKEKARNMLGLNPQKATLLFASMSGTADPRKGFDLLEGTLGALGKNEHDYQIIVIGETTSDAPSQARLPIRFLGKLTDDPALVLAYSAADALIVPSRQDNLPNTIVEALACGTPVAAFRVGGIPEMIKHQQTGFLADPFDTRQLFRGIAYLLESDRRQTFSVNARASAERFFAPRVIAEMYKDVYDLQLFTR